MSSRRRYRGYASPSWGEIITAGLLVLAAAALVTSIVYYFSFHVDRTSKMPAPDWLAERRSGTIVMPARRDGLCEQRNFDNLSGRMSEGAWAPCPIPGGKKVVEPRLRDAFDAIRDGFVRR